MTDVFQLTADLVNMASESFAEGPFVDWLEADLRAFDHLEVTRVGDNIVARTNWGKPMRLMLAGHTDTVPANDNAVARIEGDTLWGVGSADMKGGLACFLALARSVTDAWVDLTFVFYAREEVAGIHSGLAELIEARPDLLEADCAILGEPTDGEIEAGCQGALRFEVTLAGARAHTARPWMGRNAVHRLAPILAELAAYEARTPTIDGCTYREAIQAVHVEGGVAGNVVPDRAMLRIHHRYAPDRSDLEAEAWVRELLAPHLEEGDTIEVVDRSLACPPSLTHPILQRLAEGGASGPPAIRAKLGWTDIARLAPLGIPATNFGSGDPEVAHMQDEHLHRHSIERTWSALQHLLGV